MFSAGKNPFVSVGHTSHKRRHSQFERQLHSFYGNPGVVSRNRLIDEFAHQLYWSLRAIQFKIFYKNDDSDDDDLADLKWEVTVPPPPLRQLAASTKFNPKWIKYMYAKFKNECPNGRMREPEFRRVLGTLVPEKKGDDYFARLFRAFANDTNYVTFQSLLECLAHLQEHSPESDAGWTVKLIAARNDEQFNFQEFYAFAQSVFALREGKRSDSDQNRESVHQRATTIFRQLDSDNDGVVTREDLVHFFQENGGAWNTIEPKVLEF